jgi:hypothetical protein
VLIISGLSSTLMISLIFLSMAADLVRKSISGYVRIVEQKLAWAFRLQFYQIYICFLYFYVVYLAMLLVDQRRMVRLIGNYGEGSYHDLCQLYRLFLSNFNGNWNVLINWSTAQWYQILWKSFQLFSGCYTRTEEQADMPKIIGIFLQFFLSNPQKSNN